MKVTAASRKDSESANLRTCSHCSTLQCSNTRLKGPEVNDRNVQLGHRDAVENFMMRSGRAADLDWVDICMWTTAGKPRCLGRVVALKMAFRQIKGILANGMIHIRNPCYCLEAA